MYVPRRDPAYQLVNRSLPPLPAPSPPPVSLPPPQPLFSPTSQLEARQLLARSSSPTLPQTDAYEHERQLKQRYGQPGDKSKVNWLDLIAVVISLLALIAGVLILNAPYAAKLGYAKQIVAIGFILGVMNQCLQRVLPYLFLLLESKYGRSILQNYEGLLRWSPLASRLSAIWRVTLVLLTLLPLALSVLYKQYSGGTASIATFSSDATHSTVAPPGLQDNVETNAIMANATTPFLSATKDDVPLPGTFPRYYGFNLMLLSTESAAALDGPLPDHVASLQGGLKSQDIIRLTANVRGTVARYNRTAESLRLTEDGYWEELYKNVKWSSSILFNGYCFGIMQKNVAENNDAAEWDCSYTVVGASKCDYGATISDSAIVDSFEKTSLRFDVRRHACRGTWEITRQSIELVSGDCDAEPLEPKYQFYGNSQMSITDRLAGILTWTLSPFITTRKTSHWLMPTHAAVLASAFQSVVTNGNGYVSIQPAGPIWVAWKVKDRYVEIYESEQTVEHFVHTINDLWSLYIILAVQPLFTVIAYMGMRALYGVPLGRSFGVVSLLAGVDREALDLLRGAGFSGELSRNLTLRVRVLPPHGEGGRDAHTREAANSMGRIEYSIDTNSVGVNDRLRARTVYE